MNNIFHSIILKSCLLISVIFLFSAKIMGQQTTKTVQHPAYVKSAVYFAKTPALRDMKLIAPGTSKKEEEENEFPNKKRVHGFIKGSKVKPSITDPALQKNYNTEKSGIKAPVTLQNFDALSNITGSVPPDTQGDVSTDYYFEVTNMSFAIYKKSNHALVYGPADNSTIWQGTGLPGADGIYGDGIVLYDKHAQRWLFSQLGLPNGLTPPCYEMVAISQSSDPTGAWYTYSFQFNELPDYPKFGVWPDGYYLSENAYDSQQTWLGSAAAVFDRAAMLSGNANAQMIYFAPDTSRSSMLPSDWDGQTAPASGSPNYYMYFLDDAWGYPQDELDIWALQTNWNNVNLSTFTKILTLPTDSFNSSVCGLDSTTCIPQQNSSQLLDALSDRLMYRLQYRNFGTYEGMVANHSVNPSGNGTGIRWYELRNTGTGWSIYQQGTFAPQDNHYRWMGSIAMNGIGDIALGYSVSGTTLYPSIRFTGRHASDPLGTMTITETSIVSGNGYQRGSNRWGDYSMMSVDPSDDYTFWYTQEYYRNTSRSGWQTRIASFQFPQPIYTLSGVLTYDNSQNTVLGKVLIKIKNIEGTYSDTNTTDAKGNFIFKNLINDSYQLIPQISKTWGGVDPTDALIVDRYYIGSYSFKDNLLKLASDVNNDTKINPADALIINRRYIGNISSFKAGDWLYEKRTVVVNNSDKTQNIKAVCFGDVNGSYIPK